MNKQITYQRREIVPIILNMSGQVVYDGRKNDHSLSNQLNVERRQVKPTPLFIPGAAPTIEQLSYDNIIGF